MFSAADQHLTGVKNKRTSETFLLHPQFGLPKKVPQEAMTAKQYTWHPYCCIKVTEVIIVSKLNISNINEVLMYHVIYAIKSDSSEAFWTM